VRVGFSKSREAIYYGEYELVFLKGLGYKANYVDIHSGDHFWVSNPKRSGHDTLYPGIIEIDEDVKEEYWLKIRKRPDLVDATSYRSEGKHLKRKPA